MYLTEKAICAWVKTQRVFRPTTWTCTYGKNQWAVIPKYEGAQQCIKQSGDSHMEGMGMQNTPG
jgi:hypothetical protein